MKRIITHRLAVAALLLVTLVVGLSALGFAASTPAPQPTAAILKTRVFNDCGSSTLTTVNNYPSLISFDDQNVDCFGFANLHVWTLSEDGVNEGVFDNPAHFRLALDFKIEGTGNGEGGIRVSPWYSHDADGLFNVRSTDGEIACFGGRLPFYTFTGAYGLHYVKGDVIHLEVIYEPHTLNAGDPGTIEYRVRYNGTDYSSGILPFDSGNLSEDPPHGLYGILNDARVGGHFKAFLGQGVSVGAKATFSNIVFSATPVVDGALTHVRVFNDCGSSTLTTVENYPSEISFHDENLDCFGFANLHVWTFTENGAEAIFNNNASYRVATDFKIEGSGNGEGGIRISPWYSHDADGLFNVRSTDGEIACFGGRLPFYTFTGAFSLHYAKGNTIHLEAIYTPNARTAANPATIEYKVSYLGTDYSSGVIPFDEGNTSEDPPHTLYGMLNGGRVGGHFKAFLGQGVPVDVKGTFTNIKFSTCLHPANIALDIKPDKLNLNSKAKWVTAYITTTSPDQASDIDVASLTLNGVPVSADFAPFIGNQNTLLKVRFDRTAVLATLGGGSSAELVLRGEIGGACIEASDFILISTPQVLQPRQGDHLVAGQVAVVKWEVDPSASPMWMYSTTDDGATWQLEATNIPNTGTYQWTVPNLASDNVRLSLVSIYETDETGPVARQEYAQSGPFSVQSTLGVVDGRTALSLRASNPMSGDFSLSFSLPSAAGAQLAVFDIAGRAMFSREVGGRAGTQTVSFGRLPVGLYVVRLSQAGRSLSQRVAVIH